MVSKPERILWSNYEWQKVIWSDAILWGWSSFILFVITGCVFVWRTSQKACDPDCFLSVSNMEVDLKWSEQPLVIFCRAYIHPLKNSIWEWLCRNFSITRTSEVQAFFPAKKYIFQDFKCPIHAVRPLKSWFKKHVTKSDISVLNPRWSEYHWSIPVYFGE